MQCEEVVSLVLLFRIESPNEGKGNYTMSSFHEELEQVLDEFPTYHIKILLGAGRGETCNSTVVKPRFYEPSNDKRG
jgi:hypothetical protein